MHQNRSIYTLPEYQKIIRGRYHRLGLVCENNKTGTFKIFRPVPATPWIPEGRKKYFRKLRSRLNKVRYNHHFTFCTLTYDNKLYSPSAVAARIKHDIDLFFKRLDYHDKRPEYFYVVELTDNFYPHIHLIFDRYIHKSKINASWSNVTASPSTKIQHIPYKSAFYYCTKYLSDSLKQAEGKWSFIFSHIDRIWTCSRKFFDRQDLKNEFFSFCFIIWNKNNILSEYESQKGFETQGVDLSELDYELLNYDSLKINCQIQSAPARSRTPDISGPVRSPVQATFDFFTTSIYYT